MVVAPRAVGVPDVYKQLQTGLCPEEPFAAPRESRVHPVCAKNYPAWFVSIALLKLLLINSIHWNRSLALIMGADSIPDRGTTCKVTANCYVCRQTYVWVKTREVQFLSVHLIGFWLFKKNTVTLNHPLFRVESLFQMFIFLPLKVGLIFRFVLVDVSAPCWVFLSQFWGDCVLFNLASLGLRWWELSQRCISQGQRFRKGLVAAKFKCLGFQFQVKPRMMGDQPLWQCGCPQSSAWNHSLKKKKVTVPSPLGVRLL